MTTDDIHSSTVFRLKSVLEEMKALSDQERSDHETEHKKDKVPTKDKIVTTQVAKSINAKRKRTGSSSGSAWSEKKSSSSSSSSDDSDFEADSDNGSRADVAASEDDGPDWISRSQKPAKRMYGKTKVRSPEP